jgi:hypothetical protein
MATNRPLHFAIIEVNFSFANDQEAFECFERLGAGGLVNNERNAGGGVFGSLV